VIDKILNLIGNCTVYDLAQPYFIGMPHHPVHPAFTFSMIKKHGDFVIAGEVSSAAEAFGMGGHVGTHIDALCHFSRGGKLHGGQGASEVQSHATGVSALSVETIAPILRRGVLLDIATLQRADALPVDFAITPEHFEKAEQAAGVRVRSGDVVLVRTGWARFWDDPARYISDVCGPGPELAGAEWLSARGIFAAGSDTIAFEKIPSKSMPVHVHLLIERGIHIIEALNMEELSRAGGGEFLFVAVPLRIRGGTGSPMRPIALVPKEDRRAG
jgi:kynurenine formamidase